jgi:hypothetical protein
VCNRESWSYGQPMTPWWLAILPWCTLNIEDSFVTQLTTSLQNWNINCNVIFKCQASNWSVDRFMSYQLYEFRSICSILGKIILYDMCVCVCVQRPECICSFAIYMTCVCAFVYRDQNVSVPSPFIWHVCVRLCTKTRMYLCLRHLYDMCACVCVQRPECICAFAIYMTCVCAFVYKDQNVSVPSPFIWHVCVRLCTKTRMYLCLRHLYDMCVCVCAAMAF